MAPVAVQNTANGGLKEDYPSGVDDVVKKTHMPAGLEKDVPNPGKPRANTAPSSENTRPGTTGKQTIIQAHLLYWDFDQDGIIYPWDTYHGFHNIGFNFVLSFIAVLVVHGSFSYFTSPSWIPDLRFPIYIENAHRCKHGSDSESIDTEGRFVPQKFEEAFSKYSKSRKDALNPSEIFAMLRGNRNILDPTGWTAAALEWYALWWVAGDEESYITKERARASFDGSLWPILAEEQKAKKAQKKRAKAH